MEVGDWDPTDILIEHAPPPLSTGGVPYENISPASTSPTSGAASAMSNFSPAGESFADATADAGPPAAAAADPVAAPPAAAAAAGAAAPSSSGHGGRGSAPPQAQSLILQALQIPALARSAVVLLRAMNETHSLGDGELRRMMACLDAGEDDDDDAGVDSSPSAAGGGIGRKRPRGGDPSDDVVGFNVGLGIGIGVSLGASLGGTDVGESLRRLSAGMQMGDSVSALAAESSEWDVGGAGDVAGGPPQESGPPPSKRRRVGGGGAPSPPREAVPEAAPAQKPPPRLPPLPVEVVPEAAPLREQKPLPQARDHPPAAPARSPDTFAAMPGRAAAETPEEFPETAAVAVAAAASPAAQEEDKAEVESDAEAQEEDEAEAQEEDEAEADAEDEAEAQEEDEAEAEAEDEAEAQEEDEAEAQEEDEAEAQEEDEAEAEASPLEGKGAVAGVDENMPILQLPLSPSTSQNETEAEEKKAAEPPDEKQLSAPKADEEKEGKRESSNAEKEPPMAKAPPLPKTAKNGSANKDGRSKDDTKEAAPKIASEAGGSVAGNGTVCIPTRKKGDTSGSTLCVRVPANTNALISGRESHTSNMENFERLLEKLRGARRPTGENENGGDDDDDDDDEDDVIKETPFNEAFWSFVGSVLAKAVPVGFRELPDPNDVQPKGPADSAAFLAKFMDTAVLNPIHPVVISAASTVPVDVAMTELFHAAKAGLLDMKWGPLCERCGSTACASRRLQDLPRRAYCDGCKYLNDADSLDKIKVVFNLSPDVFYTPMESFACTPSRASMAANVIFAVVPATSTGSGFRYSAGCGGDLAVCPALPPGRYRMHCPVAKTDNFLVVRRDATESDRPVRLRLLVSDLVCHPGGRRKTFIVPHGKIHFDVYTDTRSFFVLWVQHDLDDGTLLYLPQEERPPFTTAREVLEHPAFQRLFEDQVEEMVLAAVRQMRPAAEERGESRGDKAPGGDGAPGGDNDGGGSGGGGGGSGSGSGRGRGRSRKRGGKQTKRKKTGGDEG